MVNYEDIENMEQDPTASNRKGSAMDIILGVLVVTEAVCAVVVAGVMVMGVLAEIMDG